jgi:hypothetical protein
MLEAILLHGEDPGVDEDLGGPGRVEDRARNEGSVAGRHGLREPAGDGALS